MGSSAGCSNSKLLDHFVGMGFEVEMVAKAIQEHGKKSVSFDFGTIFFFKSSCTLVEYPGEENSDIILETLLTYSVSKLISLPDAICATRVLML